jgi:hypothetical protein
MPDREAQARKDRWTALTRYDPEIAPLAEMLSVFGKKWVDEFENAFFALNEDRSYLNTIISRLISEAEIERRQEALRKENEWLTRIQITNAGEITSDYSLKVLKEAMALGFEITPTENHTIVVSKSGRGTSYLHSNAAIERFAKIEKMQISES